MKSKAIRDLATAHQIDGKSTAETAACLKVSQRTIQLWNRIPALQGERNLDRSELRKLTREQEAGVLSYISGRAGTFLDEIVKYAMTQYSVAISRSTASNILTRNGLTRKRGTRVNLKYKPDKGMQYLERIRCLYSPMIASMDEMSVMLNLAPLYGYAPRGERAVIPQPSRREVSFMLMLCISPIGVLYWTLRTGSINSEVFCDFLRKMPDGLTLMLDNAPIHHAKNCLKERGLPTVKEVADSKSITLEYIPAYAPHLNPVEHTFNTVRNLLRRKEAYSENKFMQSVTDLFHSDSFSQDSMTKLFKSVVFGGRQPGERLKL